MRVIGIADSDSYLKWAGSFLGAWPAGWTRELLIVRTPAAPSDAQRRAALSVSPFHADEVDQVGLRELIERVKTLQPDAVLVATRGPIAAVLLRLFAELHPRPVLVSGLPGISIPATTKALTYRRQADLFVLHSRRELREFAELARSRGLTQRFALAGLPFAVRVSPRTGTDLVFAAQAVVPRDRDDRMRVARLLVAVADGDPDRRVVVKLRAAAGEQQTHAEEDGYSDLIAEALGGRQSVDNLVVSTGPMSRALDRAEGLLTVSSTAAIEAIARGIPVIALDTFGVSDALINPVFIGSGLLAGESAAIAREFRHPDPSWLDDNYFHDPAADDVAEHLEDLVAAAHAGRLPDRPVPYRVGGGLRRAWDRRRAFGRSDRSISGLVAVAVGVPARALVRAARAIS